MNIRQNNNLLNIFLSAFFLVLLNLIISHNYSLAQQNPPFPVQADINSNKTITLEINAELPKELETNIKSAIKDIYGEKHSEEIFNNVLNIINDTKEQRSLKLLQEDLNRPSDWYKDEIIYMFYAKDFGVNNDETPNTFKNLIGMLDYLHDLGVTTIYILPFMDSPMGDAGFDIRDPKKVQSSLGGTEEFDKFILEARKRGFKIKSDLIINHFSDQHKWFQDILKGDIEKLNYFIYLDHLPKYKKYRDLQKGYVVDYKEDDGKISSRRLIFSDISDNHYRKVNVNGKDYYFYHTFYPFQLDINWRNPKVLYEVLDIISYWANLGIDIFRVDAVPYFVKKEGTTAENLPETHAVVRLLSSFLQAISPKSVLLAEACQWPSDIVPYYGRENLLPPKDLLLYMGKEYKIKLNTSKEITRTDEVQAGYHFPIMPAIWSSMLTENNQHFWKAIDNTPKIPESTTWAVFLRVHDELTLEMIDPQTRKIIYDKIIPYGQEFRKGLGVSGRMANFLNKNPDRITLAFSILLSLPGIPIIYYGDEIGALNNFEYAKKAAAEREMIQKQLDKNIKVLSFYDSRDINRGPIKKSTFYEALNNTDNYKSQIYYAVKNMINLRKENSALRRGSFKKVPANKNNILAYLRENKDQKILVIHNLSAKQSSAILYLDNKLLKELQSNNSNPKDLITGKQMKLISTDKDLKITLKPYQKIWLVLYHF